VLFHTPLFTFVRPLVLLIFTNLTCFVCFVLNRSLHHELTKGAKMDMKNPEVRSNAYDPEVRSNADAVARSA
jgi:hypothetical protein